MSKPQSIAHDDALRPARNHDHAGAAQTKTCASRWSDVWWSWSLVSALLAQPRFSAPEKIALRALLQGPSHYGYAGIWFESRAPAPCPCTHALHCITCVDVCGNLTFSRHGTPSKRAKVPMPRTCVDPGAGHPNGAAAKPRMPRGGRGVESEWTQEGCEPRPLCTRPLPRRNIPAKEGSRRCPFLPREASV